MLKKVWRFFKDYKQLGFVVLSLVVGAALDLANLDSAAHVVLGLSALINVVPLVMGMWQSFRDGSYGLDILALAAIVTSVILHEYWAAMVIVLMLTGGEALEDYAKGQAKKELSALLERKPKKAHLLKGTNVVEVRVSQIKVGDKLRILPGEVVPVDAVIIDGQSAFDESSLTGESLPVDRKKEDQLLSGSINIDSPVVVRALHTEADSQYEQIIKLVKSANASQSPFVRLADRYSIPFTLAAFMLAGSVWIISGEPIRFLQVLVVATPCPLLLGAPIALISGMSRAAKHGIIVKTGSALERLAEVRTIAFDKTGTLTTGMPTVKNVQPFNSFSKSEIIQAAAALESNSTHVLAQAVVNHAAEHGKVVAAKQVKELSGLGLSGRIKGTPVLVGRSNFLTSEGIDMKQAKTAPETTAVYVAIAGKLAGIITFEDTIRRESKTMLKQLKKAGIRHTLMVTGDNKATADKVAKELGIEKVEADCLPGDKIAAIEELAHRPVAFIGDGVNDAPVLTVADVGIALGARGSTAASESADIVIMQENIGKVAEGHAIAKRTFYIAKQSILLGIFISLGLMAVFATGKFKPVLGAALQEVVDIAVILNALRAHGSFKAGRNLRHRAK